MSFLKRKCSFLCMETTSKCVYCGYTINNWREIGSKYPIFSDLSKATPMTVVMVYLELDENYQHKTSKNLKFPRIYNVLHWNKYWIFKHGITSQRIHGVLWKTHSKWPENDPFGSHFLRESRFLVPRSGHCSAGIRFLDICNVFHFLF